eukprot:CAMPEP_0184695310 /NCGR_PEP_ID=MMETSP0313-20130426/2988_1 /TAXON_ID=2792 /ORGANISM="Porphyridium aerugineum, Strain SAG 1380-2" /LENGTH=502 /DNA_ID=CAMNT_0027153745 /DNA_START=254 /DNA_END=1762 /DNA_ORIENTATION=-
MASTAIPMLGAAFSLTSTRLISTLLAKPQPKANPLPKAVSMYQLVRRDIQTMCKEFPATAAGSLKIRIPKKCNVHLYAQDPYQTQAACKVWMDIKFEGDTKEVEGGADQDSESKEAAKKIAEHFGLNLIHDTRTNALRLEADEENMAPRWMRDPSFWKNAKAATSAGLGTLAASPSPSAEMTHSPTQLKMPHAISEFLHHPLSSVLHSATVEIGIVIPADFGLDLELKDGFVFVHDSFKGKECRILADSSDIIATRIQSPMIDIETNSGNISASTINGNTSFRSKTGNIACSKVEGNEIRVVTENGNIDFGSVYSKSTYVRSGVGNISIQSIHADGDTSIKSRMGNLSISGAEGNVDLEAARGDVHLQVSNPKNVFVRCYDGNVYLGLPPWLTADLDLEAGCSLKVDDAFRFHEHLGLREKFLLGILKGTETVKPKALPWASSIFVRCPKGDIECMSESWGVNKASKLISSLLEEVSKLPLNSRAGASAEAVRMDAEGSRGA